MFFLIKELNFQDLLDIKAKATNNLINEDVNGKSSKSSSDEGRKYGSSREAMSNKYAVIREQIRQSTLNTKPVPNIASAKVTLLDTEDGEPSNTNEKTNSGLASKWESMKVGFQNFKANIGTKKFLPLPQVQESKTLSHHDSAQSLDEIFQRLKRPLDHGGYSDEEDGMEIKSSERIEFERRPTR